MKQTEERKQGSYLKDCPIPGMVPGGGVLALMQETLVLGGSSLVSSAREVRLSLVLGLLWEEKLPVSQQGRVVPKGDVEKPAFDLGMKPWGK